MELKVFSNFLHYVLSLPRLQDEIHIPFSVNN